MRICCSAGKREHDRLGHAKHCKASGAHVSRQDEDERPQARGLTRARSTSGGGLGADNRLEPSSCALSMREKSRSRMAAFTWLISRCRAPCDAPLGAHDEHAQLIGMGLRVLQKLNTPAMARQSLRRTAHQVVHLRPCSMHARQQQHCTCQRQNLALTLGLLSMQSGLRASTHQTPGCA